MSDRDLRGCCLHSFSFDLISRSSFRKALVFNSLRKYYKKNQYGFKHFISLFARFNYVLFSILLKYTCIKQLRHNYVTMTSQFALLNRRVEDFS